MPASKFMGKAIVTEKKRRRGQPRTRLPPMFGGQGDAGRQAGICKNAALLFPVPNILLTGEPGTCNHRKSREKCFDWAYLPSVDFWLINSLARASLWAASAQAARAKISNQIAYLPCRSGLDSEQFASCPCDILQAETWFDGIAVSLLPILTSATAF